MKIIVVIVCYNRYYNLKHWLECWKRCHKGNAELVVLHNTDDFTDTSYYELCSSYGIRIVQRRNVGFDMGIFQDVCNDNLYGFPEWERLLWITDDTFPMDLSFVRKFSEKMNLGIGVVCMKISLAVRQHIRTTGFMIDRVVARKLKFSANPIITKFDCYQFEHRHKTLTFYDQIIRMGLRVIQVASDQTSPLWDSGYHKGLKRGDKHRAIFGEYQYTEMNLSKHNEPVHSVTFICTIYQGYPQIISSLLMQTNPNWELWLVHNGPGNVADVPNDPRIKVIYTPENTGNWGHPNRAKYLQEITTEYVVITNSDNYHVPVYVEYMLNGFNNDTIVGVYCSDMIHSYKAWQIIPCSLQRGFVDCAGMMLRTKPAQKVGWKNVTHHSADWFFFNDLITEYGADSFVKVNGCLLVHN